jgi:sugar lactone lactonase YvrE
MKTLQSKVVVDGIVYPEGIRWNQGKIWFSDILDRKVMTYDPQTGQTAVVLEPEDLPSGLGFLPDGRLLVVTMRKRQLLRLEPDGALTVVADMAHLGEILNDMVVDPQGRAYVDCHFANHDDGGGIILAEPGGACRIVAKDMNAPNGMAITPDGKTLIANDLLANSLVAFDIAADGSLENRRVHRSLGGDSPDGICLDAEGGAWVGLPFQNRFRRIGANGAYTHEIECPSKWGTAPALGGPDRKTLYLCVARVKMEDMAALLQDPTDARARCQGWIEVVEGIEASGVGWP